MTDYIIKLLTDKPIIKYIEDPLASSEKKAWKNLTEKIRSNESLKTVKIGTSNGQLLQKI